MTVVYSPVPVAWNMKWQEVGKDERKARGRVCV